jgi:manganese/iron transport system ATP-binding protein
MLNSRLTAEHPKQGPALELSGLSLRFDGHNALQDLSFSLDSGLQVAVVGPNGAGKSTLFNILAGLLTPSSGTVSIHGHPPAQHMCLAYVTQSSQVDWTFPVSVEEVVMMGRVGLIGLFKQPSRKDWLFVGECLERVQMRDLAHRQISQLSGGQKQRMFIARALAQEADLFLLDEPLAGLDTPSQEQILKILDDLKHLGITVMFATHDLDLATQFDRILLLNRKLVAFGSKDEVLTTKNLSQAYGGTMQVVKTSEGQVLLGDSGGHHGHETEGRHG